MDRPRVIAGAELSEPVHLVASAGALVPDFPLEVALRLDGVGNGDKLGVDHDLTREVDLPPLLE